MTTERLAQDDRGHALIGPRARSADADSGKKAPACGALLRTGNARQRPQQGLHRMDRGQVDHESARTELAVAFRVLERGKVEHLNSAILLALFRAEPIETVNKPTVGRQDVSMRDHVGELAIISENTDKEVMLAGFCAGKQAAASLAKAPEPNPVSPGQLRPCGAAFLPMQDDRVLGSPFHALYLVLSRL